MRAYNVGDDLLLEHVFHMAFTLPTATVEAFSRANKTVVHGGGTASAVDVTRASQGARMCGGRGRLGGPAIVAFRGGTNG